MHRSAQTVKIGSKRFYLAHGDGLYVEDKGFKLIRGIFHSPLAQKLFGLLPPQLGQEFGFTWSKKNREKIRHIENKLGEENERSL